MLIVRVDFIYEPGQGVAGTHLFSPPVFGEKATTLSECFTTRDTLHRVAESSSFSSLENLAPVELVGDGSISQASCFNPSRHMKVSTMGFASRFLAL